MNLFDVVVARKLAGGGGGGGGGGDFSIASVTINNNLGERRGVYGAFIGSRSGMSYVAPTASLIDSKTFDVAIYKDGSILQLETQTDNFSATGAIQQIDAAAFLVTGDGTITIS